MHNLLTHRDTCRLCGTTDLELALRLSPTPVGDAYVPAAKLDLPQPLFPNDLYLCRKCSHAQLLDILDPKILYGDFMYRTSVSPGLADHFKEYAATVVECLSPAAGSLVVDVGSNDGTLLNCFREQKLCVLGIDPAAHIAGEANAKGIETLPAYFTAALAREIRDTRGPAAIITSNNTFANIDDLQDIIDGFKILLADNGTLIIETGYVVDQIMAGCFDNIYHEHIGYFSVTPLPPFLKRHDLKLFDVQKRDTKGGSIRCFIQKQEGGRPVGAEVNRLLAYEEKHGFSSSTPYKKLGRQLNAAKRRLTDLCRSIMAQGKTIAGYGASVGSTTFIYEFELGGILTCIVDDNPLKHNLFSPGYHLPVVSPHALHERQPDYVMILAWRYAEAIIEKHQQFVEQGGHFIIPWPQPHIL